MLEALGRLGVELHRRGDLGEGALAVEEVEHPGSALVGGARLALATGYGMTMYRYGGTAAAAILERVE